MKSLYRILKSSGLLAFALWLSMPMVWAKPPPISEPEFRKLVADLAPKVNLFREVWRKDSSAIIYGGTSRDFLYWILRKLHKGMTPEQLRHLDNIDIRDIVGSESDADVVSKDRLDISGESYAIRKVDWIHPDRLDVTTTKGFSELHQGFLALEKIELAQDGLRPAKSFKDGVHELFTEQIGFYNTEGEEFWNTEFAAQFLNHPVFLAIRYLRIRAAHWHNTRGPGLPNREELLNYDPVIRAKIRQLVRDAITDPAFQEVLQNPKALEWFNGTILKSFRSYTNLTAAYLLFVDAGFLELQARFPEQIATINQFLFLQYRDQETIDGHFTRYKKSPKQVFVPADQLITDRILLHGTKQEESYRAMIFQNALPSEGGLAGRGLYASDLHHQDIALDFAGGTTDRIVKFTVSEDAKIIDLTSETGQDLYKAWKADHQAGTYDDFAKDFGADILKYSYRPYAFVVKNSAVLIKREGLTRKLMTTTEANEIASRVHSQKDYLELLNILRFNAFSDPEAVSILKIFSNDALVKWLILQPLDDVSFRAYWESLVFRTRFLDRSKVYELQQILIRGKLAWTPEQAEAALTSVFQKSNCGPIGLEVLADFVVDQNIHPEAFLSLVVRSLFDFRRDLTNRIILKMLERSDLAECLLALLIRDPKSISIPEDGLTWIKKLVEILGPRADILKSRILINRDRGLWNRMKARFYTSKDGIDTSAWTNQPEFSDLMLQFARMQNPPEEIIDHFAEAKSDERASTWISELIRNQSLSEITKRKMAKLILSRQFKVADHLEFIQGLNLSQQDILQWVFEGLEKPPEPDMNFFGSASLKNVQSIMALLEPNKIQQLSKQPALRAWYSKQTLLKASGHPEKLEAAVTYLQNFIPKAEVMSFLQREALRLFKDFTDHGIIPFESLQTSSGPESSSAERYMFNYLNLCEIAFQDIIAQRRLMLPTSVLPTASRINLVKKALLLSTLTELPHSGATPSQICRSSLNSIILKKPGSDFIEP